MEGEVISPMSSKSSSFLQWMRSLSLSLTVLAGDAELAEDRVWTRLDCWVLVVQRPAFRAAIHLRGEA